jgi:iron complex transport system substrate-binding protein
MKWVLAAALLITAPAAAKTFDPGVPARAGHIMSLKVCTDELLLDLVPIDRIASVTFLSREKASLAQWPQGAKVAVNHNTAEEILSTHPDLILTDSFTAPGLRAILAKSGARVLEVPPADNWEQIRAVTRQVAQAVGEEARGEALIAKMDATLRDVAAHRPSRPVTVADWGGGGFVAGTGGLFDVLLTTVGARNIERGSFAYYDVETLLAKNPDALVYGNSYAGTASLRADQDLHPALMRRYAGRRVSYSGLYGCGVPETAEVARRLQQALAQVPR